MSRKHFEAIAAALRSTRPNDTPVLCCDEHYAASTAGLDLWEEIVESMASTLAQFNSGFSRGRFLAACKGED